LRKIFITPVQIKFKKIKFRKALKNINFDVNLQHENNHQIIKKLKNNNDECETVQDEFDSENQQKKTLAAMMPLIHIINKLIFKFKNLLNLWLFKMQTNLYCCIVDLIKMIAFKNLKIFCKKSKRPKIRF
jgi:hypothetical protein